MASITADYLQFLRYIQEIRETFNKRLQDQELSLKKSKKDRSRGIVQIRELEEEIAAKSLRESHIRATQTRKLLGLQTTIDDLSAKLDVEKKRNAQKLSLLERVAYNIMISCLVLLCLYRTIGCS